MQSLLGIDVQNAIVDGTVTVDCQPITDQALQNTVTALRSCSVKPVLPERQFLLFNMTAHPVTVWRVGRKVGKFAAKWPPYGKIS